MATGPIRSPPRRRRGRSVAARDDAGRSFHGVNFASQDYLSLASHPAIKEAANEAIDEYGVHSAGSAAFLGNTRYSLALRARDRRLPRHGARDPLSDRLGRGLWRDQGPGAARRPHRHGRAGPCVPAGRRRGGDAQRPSARPPQHRNRCAAISTASARATPRTRSWSSPRACSRWIPTRPTSPRCRTSAANTRRP